MKKLPLFLAFVLGLILTTCSSAQTSITNQPPTSGGQAGADESAQQAHSPDMARSDNQGAVTFAVKPENLTNPGNVLIFDVSMNTHSVDLSMDLAQLATLATDNGRSVQAILWNAPRGGHHISGKLSFSTDVDGMQLLAGVTRLTLTIINVDAPERVFTWDFDPLEFFTPHIEKK
jgi:hypothetical protein